ncbi:MAG: radical SAM protein [Nitrospinae bacterium]|nr:radical SAM protein [Nitrospinota bacterium]
MPKDTNDFFEFSQGKLMINLTDRCNARCEMCFVTRADGWHELTREEAFSIADFALESKFPLIEISGGEPLIMSYTLELLEKVCTGFPLVQLVTNALLLNENNIKRLRKLPNLILMISLHGIGEIHDKVATVSGSFNKLTSTIDRLIEEGISFSINTVVQALNYSNVFEIYDYCSKLPYKTHAFVPTEWDPLLPKSTLIPEGQSSSIEEQLKNIKKSSQKRGKNVMISESLYKSTPVSKNVTEKPTFIHPGLHCTIPRRLLIIYNTGDVLPCYHYSWEKHMVDLNLRSYKTLKELIYSKKYHDLIAEVIGTDGCHGCNTACYGWDKDFRKKIKFKGVYEKLFEKITDTLTLKVKNKIFIFGASEMGQELQQQLLAENIDVEGFFDNSPKAEILGKPVTKPFKPDGEYLVIVASVSFAQEMTHQLDLLGVEKSRVIQPFVGS